MNVLILFSDEHRHDAMGCANHPLVKTPNLDTLADSGTRFTQAYTPSPICVPARAALATGQYVHQTRCWSNAQAYQGQPKSWGHVLQQNGSRVDSIGKLHYRGAQYKNGFENEILPLYIKNGKGWIKGLLRNHESVLDCSSYAQEIGPGDDSYTQYDLGVTQQAVKWLNNPENTQTGKPWTLFVSWLRPHYPLTCPPEFYDLYPLEKMDQARFLDDQELPQHEVLKIIRRNFNYDVHFNEQTRQVARASYYGLCSFLDAQIGQVLNTLKATGQDKNTLIVYTSDHGDHNGDRRMWTKMSLYDESSRIPMIVSGPDIPKQNEVSTLSSLVDVYPTVLEAVGVDNDQNELPGVSLRKLAAEKHRSRTILSEYHDGGSPTGMFMLRDDRWKYNYYPGYEPELFDMVNDPEELRNLAGQSNYSAQEQECHQKLMAITDPVASNDLAFSDQSAMIDSLGGVKAILASDEFDFTPIPDTDA